MTDPEKPLKEGYLWLPPKSSFLLVSKPWQRKYCRLYGPSKQGIERLEIFDSEDDQKSSSSSTLPILTLENCIKICEDVQKNQSNVFAVITKSSTHHFSANSQDDMVKWISAFQTVAFRDNASRQTIEEDNDLYCSAGDSGIFSVKLVSSDASERCGLDSGPYTLVVTPSALQLHRQADTQILVTWPYRFIRRYGYTSSSGKMFTFEAGRKCSTGEGFFKFEHSHQQEIFRCISSKMRHMKKLLSGETTPRGGEFLCGDTQFQAALSMGARSRSPLPPSPTHSTPMDSEFSSLSSAFKPLSSDNSPSSFKPLLSCDNSPTGERVFPGTPNGERILPNIPSGERIFPNTPNGERIFPNTQSGERIFPNTPSGERIFPNTPTSHVSLLEKHLSIASTVAMASLTRRGTSQERTLSRERSRSTDRSLSLERPHTLSLLPPPPLSLLPSPPPPTERPPPPPPKPKLPHPCGKPDKPPRKSLPPTGVHKELAGGLCATGGLKELTGGTGAGGKQAASYDDVELRNDAWRTLGLANAPHSERPYVVPRESPAPSSGPDTQKIFVSTSSFSMNDYDTLQHLGATSKVVSPGYRQVGPSLTLARTRSSEMLDDLVDNKTDHQLICSAKV